MKRSAIVSLGIAMLALVALVLSCAKSPPTASDPPSTAIEDKAIYDRGGVRVFRMANQPSMLWVRYQMFQPGGPASGAKLLTYHEAVGSLADDAKVSPVAVWREIPSRLFDPSSGVRGEIPRVRTPAQPFGGGEPPGGCSCECCVYMGGGVCSCSWGCLKVCYRGAEEDF